MNYTIRLTPVLTQQMINFVVRFHNNVEHSYHRGNPDVGLGLS